MATLSRVWRLGSQVVRGSSPLIRRNLRSIPCLAYSSTTKKVEQSEFVIGKQTEIDPARVEEIIAEGSREESNSDASDPTYVSHGFHEDPYWDTYAYRVIFFVTLSICMVFGPAYVHYIPDPSGREWARREAVIVLNERRAAGELVIDPTFIDPSKLILPEADPEPMRTK